MCITNNYYQIWTSLCIDIVQTVNVSVEASLQINNITFTPLYIEESVQLFGVAGIVHIEDENFTSLSSDDHSTSSSCCVVFLGPNSEAVLSSNIVRYVYLCN